MTTAAVTSRKGRTLWPFKMRLAVIVFLPLLAAAVWLNVQNMRKRAVQQQVNAGMAALQQKQPLLALKEWKKALVTDPAQPEPYLLLASLYIHIGQPQQAIPLLKHLYQIAPTTHHVLCRLAEAYALTNQSSLMLKTAQQAVKVEPACPRAHTMLGIALGNVQDHTGAISELTRAAALAPGDPYIATTLAQAQLDTADLKGSEQTLQQVLAVQPNYATAWYVLGWAYARSTPTPQNVQAAIHAFQKLQALDSSRTDALAELGRLQMQQGNAAAAASLLQTAWNRGMQSQEVAFDLASAYRRTGKTAQAAAMDKQFQRISQFNTEYQSLQKQLITHPHNVSIALELAQLEIGAKDYAAAQPLMNVILQQDAENPTALQCAIRLYQAVGEKQIAQAYQQRLHNLQALKGDKP